MMDELLKHIAVGAVVRPGDTLVIGLDPSETRQRVSQIADELQKWGTKQGITPEPSDG